MSRPVSRVMSPAQRQLIAWEIATTHAHLCPHCQPPSLDRPMTRRCGTGIKLDLDAVRAWRDTVLALSDRGPR